MKSIEKLSNEMFKGSEPMSGEELRILRKTASRLISKTPTTLNKKEILEQLSKKCTVVSFKNKEKRKSFDETFGDRKMELARKVIGDNSDILLEKLNKKEPEKKG